MSMIGRYYYDAYEIIDSANSLEEAKNELEKKGYSSSDIESFLRDWKAMVDPFGDAYGIH